MLAETVIENTVLSAFGIFKSVSCLIRMRLRKIFFANMFFYLFLQLCPQGHISKMLAVTVIENTVLCAFGIFKSVSCLIRMRLRENFFCKHVLLSFSSTLSPRSYLENACCNRYWKHGFKRLWNFQIRFLPYSNAFARKFFLQTCSFIISSTLSPRSYLENACCNRYWNGFENSKGA